MGWADYHIANLAKGEQVSFRPKGNSMQGKIESGNLCTVCPPDKENLKVGDIVLCKVKGNQYLHLISATREGQFQISNNKGYVNGWISPEAIFGKLLKVEP